MEERLLEELIDNVRNKHFGKYRGTVVNNQDPTSKGRIQVSVPAVLGELIAWAMPCLPYAGMNVGMFIVPEIGSGVWVEFEGGDPSFPIYTGGWWGDGDVPMAETGAPATPMLKVFRSKTGLLLSFDDTTQVLSVSDAAGTNLLTIEVLQGKITLKGATKAVVEAPRIELIENAPQWVVLGDNLITYLNQIINLFNTHQHPGENWAGVLPVTVAPAIPQMPPPPGNLLSKKVKTG